MLFAWSSQDSGPFANHKAYSPGRKEVTEVVHHMAWLWRARIHRKPGRLVNAFDPFVRAHSVLSKSRIFSLFLYEVWSCSILPSCPELPISPLASASCWSQPGPNRSSLSRRSPPWRSFPHFPRILNFLLIDQLPTRHIDPRCSVNSVLWAIKALKACAHDAIYCAVF